MVSAGAAEKVATDADNDAEAPVAGRIYQSAAEGQKALQSRYEYWTAKINEHSFQVSISLIAANWAVHSSSVSGSVLAVFSIAFALLTLLLSLGGALGMSLLHYSAFYDSVKNNSKWNERWKDAERNQASPWPFTHGIISLGIWIAWLKVIIPCVSAILFLLGAIYH